MNSFGADSDGSDAEFYFAVSLRELLPFLRAHDVNPRTSAMPCRSIEELNAAERARLEEERAAARQRIENREALLREQRAALRLLAQVEIMEERENAMALAMVLLVAIGCIYAAVQLRRNPETRVRAIIFAGLGNAAMIGAIMVWLWRPGFDEIERRVDAAMDKGGDPMGASEQPSQVSEGTLICTFDPDRSRVTGAGIDDVEFDWAANGCVNGRTQYGLRDDEWSRVFVPNAEAAVSVNTYDPDTRTFRTDRYLLRQGAMAEARTARDQYRPPACGVSSAAERLGEQQSQLLAMLPDRPNERLVYSCEAKRSGGSGL